MKISDEDLGHLEELARITLPDEERDPIREDLAAILDYFALLGDLDTDGVPELVRPVPLTNVLRDDEVRASLPRQAALGLAVETEDGFFKVPRTLEGDD